MKLKCVLNDYILNNPMSYMCLLFALGCYGDWAFARADVKSFAANIKSTFITLKEVMTVAAYVAGAGFTFIGLLKFKAHKDNPAQIPLSTPIALIAIGAGLLFLPTVFDIAGDAVFGQDAQPGLPREVFYY